jgi:hypothetical protein
MNHYVYLIEKKNTLPNQQKYYIGVRSCECKIGEDSYMGSSKYLTEEVETLGADQFNKIILKRFNNRLDANLYEIQMHEKFDVANNFIFFNRVKQKDRGLGVGPGELNPFYGRKHTEEYKQRQSILLKTKDCRSKTLNFGLVHTEETKLKMSLKRKEWMSKNKHPRKDKIATEEERKAWGSNFKTHLKAGCKHCNKIGSVANMVRWHNDNCKKRMV